MKVTKATLQVPIRKDGGDYMVFDTLDEMLNDDGAAIADFCTKLFEAMTGLVMKDGEMALVTFDVTKVDRVTKKANYVVEKVK